VGWTLDTGKYGIQKAQEGNGGKEKGSAIFNSDHIIFCSLDGLKAQIFSSLYQIKRNLNKAKYVFFISEQSKFGPCVPYGIFADR
jgi:hypothetical protein